LPKPFLTRNRRNPARFAQDRRGRNRKGRPVARTALDTIAGAADYIVFDMFDIIMSFDIIVSFIIMPPFDAPSTAVMLSDMVSMPSVAFMSVIVVLSVVSVFEPHADTARAAAASAELARTLVMTARMKIAP
jgi:hypothetical protein